jgi:ring-1,2-phenylacetyl-CoA epoxidase subunit PaaC
VSLPGYVLGLADDALVLAQRTSEWTARAPTLEEDVALANIALDLLGQARYLLTYAGAEEGAGRDEDALAYRRPSSEFRNVHLVELPNGDFGRTIARLLVFSAYRYELLTRLADSADPTLAAVAAKGVKEVAYHRDHAAQWTVRLGAGTTESRRRMGAGLADVWPYTPELFTEESAALVAAGVAVDPVSLSGPWLAFVSGVLTSAGLVVPDVAAAPGGGRRGVHTDAMGPLLDELQSLHRAHPGAVW